VSHSLQCLVKMEPIFAAVASRIRESPPMTEALLKTRADRKELK